MIAMLGVFAYIWYWGGFEKDENGQSTQLQCLEKILNDSQFEADNKELPENLEAAHKIIVSSIIEKVENKKEQMSYSSDILDVKENSGIYAYKQLSQDQL
jgi:hypothetical protein